MDRSDACAGSSKLPRSRSSWVVTSFALRAVAGPASRRRERVRHTDRTTLFVRVPRRAVLPSGFRPRIFEAVLAPRPLLILRRHSRPGGDLQRLHRCTALRACWAVLPVRGLCPAGFGLQQARIQAAHPSRRYRMYQQAACLRITALAHPERAEFAFQRSRLAALARSRTSPAVASSMGLASRTAAPFMDVAPSLADRAAAGTRSRSGVARRGVRRRCR